MEGWPTVFDMDGQVVDREPVPLAARVVGGIAYGVGWIWGVASQAFRNGRAAGEGD